MKIRIPAVCLLMLFLLSLTLTAKDKPVYEFTIEKEMDHTPVKSQARSSTCWCFATISMLESEVMRMGRKEIDLSEMFVVRHTYPLKADHYVRMHGNANFAGGGYYHDVMTVLRTEGLVPESVYSGLHPDEKRINHGEMHSVLKGCRLFWRTRWRRGGRSW